MKSIFVKGAVSPSRKNKKRGHLRSPTPCRNVDRCTCTALGNNFAVDRRGDSHVWQKGICWPRPLDLEIKRLAETMSVEDIAVRVRLTPRNVRRILDGTVKLDYQEPHSWLWVDPEEPGFPFAVQKNRRSLTKLIRQAELRALFKVQRIALGWTSVLVNKKRNKWTDRMPYSEPMEDPDWVPWPFGHRYARLLVNRIKNHNAKIWAGDKTLTTDGRVLVDGAWYSRLWRAERGVDREFERAAEDAERMRPRMGRPPKSAVVRVLSLE